MTKLPKRLTLSTSEFAPLLRWMPSVSKWRVYGADGPEDIDLDEAIFDMENLRLGWCLIKKDQPARWEFDPNLSHQGDKPEDDEDWQRGASVDVVHDQFGRLNLSGTTKGLFMALHEMWPAFVADYEGKIGKVPVFRQVEIKSKQFCKGATSYPVMKLVKWVARPPAVQDGDATGCDLDVELPF